MLNLQQKTFLFCEKVPLGALASPNVSHPGFSVKGKLLGPQGQNVKHISSVTGAKIQLRGRGASQNPEADGPEDMFLEINASSEVSMKQALELAFNLVETIRLEYVASVTTPLQSTTQSNMSNASGVQRVAGQSYSSQYHPAASYLDTHGDVKVAPPPFNFPHQLSMHHPVPQSPYNNASGTPIGPSPSNGCVPFLYPDGDAVIRSHSSKQDISNSVSSMKTPVPQMSTTNCSDAIPARLSLNGSTFAVVARPKEVNSTSSRSSSSSGSSNSNSSSDTSGRSGDDSAHTSSGSSKRRRGFKENAVYTATSEGLMPTSSTHQTTISWEKSASSADTVVVRRPIASLKVMNSESVGGALWTGHSVKNPPNSAHAGQMGLTTSSAHRSESQTSLVVTEPAPSVVSALAAMTQRRMQNKGSRPLVPSFFDMQSSLGPSFPPSGSTAPSHCQRPSKESLRSAAPCNTEPPDTSSLATPSPAVVFKIPGLTAYEDDEEDD